MNRAGTKSKTSKTLFGLIAIFIISILFSGGCSKDDNTDNQAEIISKIESINYLTEHYPPLNYEMDNELFGLSVDILEGLFDKMDVNQNRDNISLMNWSEAYDIVQQEEGSMLFSMARLPDRELLFKWVGPIAPEKNLILSLTNNNIIINDISELNSYELGVIEDYAAILLLEEQGLSSSGFLEFGNVVDMYNGLLNGIVDCIIYSETGNTLIMEAMNIDTNDIESIYNAGVIENYYAFHKNTSEEIIQLFQSSLEELKMDKAEDGSSVYEKILNSYQIIQHVEDGITEEMAIALVDFTVAELESDAAGTISKINQQLPPYKDEDNPALYTFVYDTAINMLAHANNEFLIGQNFKGKTDAAGKKFRDEIVTGALEHGNGWTDYIYTKPDQSGLFHKSTYYQLVTGNDGNYYIVCAGRYL